MLNWIWLGFFLSAFAAALWQWLGLGDADVFSRLVAALFDMARLSVEIVLVLVGTMTLWLGFLQIAERAGLIAVMARLLDPLFRRLMPEVPSGHPALGHITMNFAANVLGLDNAATPIGIKAMHSLQSLNPSKDTASNAQILFMVDPDILTTTLGVVVIVYVAINATGFAIRISDSASPWAAPPLGILSGLLTGTTGSVGIPIALYLQARGLDKESFLRAIALTFLISASMLVIALLEKGALGKETALLSAASLIPAFAGMAIGQRLRGRLSEDLFRKFVFLFLMVAAANLIRKGLF